MIKIVFFGVGNMGQMAHLKNYMVLPECEVVAIIEARNGLAQEVATRYGVSKTFNNLEDFKAARMEFDGFVASQPYRNNKNVLPELFSFGKPIFMEKPIALSVETAQGLVELERQSGAPLMIGYHKRSDPAMEFAIKIIEQWKRSGEFGKLKYLRATMPEGDWIAGGFDGVIQSDEVYPQVQMEEDVDYYENADHNTFYDVFVNYYIHQVNAVRFLLGEDYTPVYAEPSKTLLVGKSQSGIPTVIEMTPFKNSLDWAECYMVCFERGYIQIELPAPLATNQSGRVTVMEDCGGVPKTWSPTLPFVHAMKNQASNFIEFIKGTRTATCVSQEAVKDLVVAREYVKLIASHF